VSESTFILQDNGKEGSAVNNFIGISWALRKEGLNGALFVPKDDAKSDVFTYIDQYLRELRAKYAGRAGTKRAGQDASLANRMLGASRRG
jgi:hypothetical protein